MAFLKDEAMLSSIDRWAKVELDVRKLQYETYELVSVLLLPGDIV